MQGIKIFFLCNTLFTPVKVLVTKIKKRSLTKKIKMLTLIFIPNFYYLALSNELRRRAAW